MVVVQWVFFYSLLRDPQYNKGHAFTKKERDAHYLRGLLPPIILSQQLQGKKLMQNIRQIQVPLQKYIALMELQDRNERLFYKLLIDNVEELLPVVYTPTVSEACQKYGSIFKHPQGLYIHKFERKGSHDGVGYVLGDGDSCGEIVFVYSTWRSLSFCSKVIQIKLVVLASFYDIVNFWSLEVE
ncbi:hypothetical protein SO802_010155 [Lithocarpus litseifolius]|uniref:Malic enzyme N-terminal domain-containing protein n=1 Tax=Lithocarpus litseifolius TaxID=425828 RepID=A0AAW2DG34_9ROSI